MGIGAISTTFFTEKLYVQNKDSVEAERVLTDEEIAELLLQL